MIIDAHQHPHETVVEEMDAQGIDKAVLLPVGTEFAKIPPLMEAHPGRFIPFFWINLEDIGRSLQELEQAVQAYGVKGIKFQPLIQHFRHHEKRLYPVYEKCIELGLAVTFHTGMVAFYKEFGIPHLGKYTHPMPLDEVAFDLPELKIIIAHMGGNYHYEALLLAEKHKNIYMDTAYLPFFCKRMLPAVMPLDLIKRAIGIIGHERILYGYEGLAPDVIKGADLPDEVKQAILGGNAARLLGLPDGHTSR